MEESVIMFCNKCGYELNGEDVFCSKCGNKIERQQSNDDESIGVLETFHTNAHLNNGDLSELLKTKSSGKYQKKTIRKEDITYYTTKSVSSDNHESEKNVLDNAETTLSSLELVEMGLHKKISDLGVLIVYHKPNKKDYKIKSTFIGRTFRIIFIFLIIFCFIIVITNMDFNSTVSEINTQIISEIFAMICIAAILWAAPVRNHILSRKAYKNAVENYEQSIVRDTERCKREKAKAAELNKFLSVVKEKKEQLKKVFGTAQEKYRESRQLNAHGIYDDIKSHNDNENKAVTISNSIISELEMMILDKTMEVTNFNQLINAADEIIKVLN